MSEQDVDRIVDELCDLSPEERSARLDGYDVSSDVRQQIETFLRHFDAMLQDPESMPAVGAVEEMVQGDSPGGSSDPVRIGSYSVIRKLGEGGMGVVYAARRDESAQVAALKVVRVELASSPLLHRFQRETDVLRKLRHPGIAAFYDSGETDVVTAHGASVTLPYLAMEYVDGLPLHRYADQHGLDSHQRLVAMARVCDAVQHAHESGIVHRDLKPENVLVTDGADAIGQPKVLDFGIASAADADVHTLERTQTGALIGTLQYMSPEQVAGRHDEVGARSDVYSLGVLLFELLTGQLPYAVRGRSIPDAAHVIQTEEPVRLGTLVPALRGDVDHIVAQALEKERERRYASAADLARDLRAAAEGRTVMARGPGVVRRVRKWTARHPGTSAAAGVGVVAIAVMTVLLLQAVDARNDADDNAVRAAVNEQAAADKAREAEANAEAARQAQAVAEQRGRELAEERAALLRLSDLKAVRDLEAEANELWPAHPDLVDDMERWLERAEALTANLRDHALVMIQLQRGEGDLARSLTAQQRAWWLDVLDELTREMAALADAGGSMESVRARLDSSRTIVQRSLVEPAVAWEEARAYARNPDGPYAGLDLAPQLGLVPLGPDPDSGLLEFWHVESGTRPQRGADGRWFMLSETGLVLILVPGLVQLIGSQSDDPEAPHYYESESVRGGEGPVHEVELSPYFLSKYEMSQGQWLRKYDRVQPLHIFRSQDGRAYPMDSVSWPHAMEVMRRLDLTLPSEAQWEVAARAGTSTAFWFGDDPADMARHGNVGDQSAIDYGAPSGWAGEPWHDGHFYAAPPGTYPANPFGFHEMTGNMREHCLDAFDYDFYAISPRVDPVNHVPQFEGAGWVLRDGDFASPAQTCRSSARASGDEGQGFFGVRPARRLEPAAP